MKNISSLFILLVLFACNVKEPEESQGDWSEYDPHFIKSSDTFTTYGPRNITRNILQDRKGNFWIASWEGLIHYNGKLFTNITLKKGLRHFRVFCLLEDKSGTLWFGTIGAGVYRFDGSTFVNLTTKEGLIDNSVECIFEDEAGTIWFGTQGGVSSFAGNTFTNFTIQDGLTCNVVHSISQDTKKVIWFGTDCGVNQYNGKSFSNFVMNDSSSFTNVRTIIQDKTGNMWIGGAKGFFCYDGKSLTTVSTDLDFVSYIFQDKEGNFWLSGKEADVKNGTFIRKEGMGLFRYNRESFVKIIEKSGGNDRQIFGAIEDKTGNIWFGTMNGVGRFDGKLVEYFTN